MDSLSNKVNNDTIKFVNKTYKGLSIINSERFYLPTKNLYDDKIENCVNQMHDILDEISDPALLGKPQGADKRHGKSTYLSLLGEHTARQAAETQLTLAKQALQALPLEAPLLNELAQFAIERRY